MPMSYATEQRRNLMPEQPVGGRFDHPGVLLGHRETRPPRVDADAVPIKHLAKLPPGSSMSVPAERARLVDDAVAVEKNSRQHLRVPSGTAPRPSVERFVE